MQSSLIHNGFNLQRRKQYQANPRHNLNSSINFVWRQSLDSYPMKRSDMMKHQKQLQHQNFKNRYNQLMDQHIKKEMSLGGSSYRVMPVPQKAFQYKNIGSTITNQKYGNNTAIGGNYIGNEQYAQKREFQNNQIGSSFSQYQSQHEPALYPQYYPPPQQQPLVSSSSQHYQNPHLNSYSDFNNKHYKKQVLNRQVDSYDSSKHPLKQSQSIYQKGNNIQGQTQNLRNSYHQQSYKSKYEDLSNSKPAGFKLHSSQNASKTIFGYDVNKVPQKKNSYFNQILNSRLQKALSNNKSNSNNNNQNQNQKNSSPIRHQAFTINHPVYINY